MFWKLHFDHQLLAGLFVLCGAAGVLCSHFGDKDSARWCFEMAGGSMAALLMRMQPHRAGNGENSSVPPLTGALPIGDNKSDK